MQIRSVLPVLALAVLFVAGCALKPITAQDVRAPQNVYKKWVLDASLQSIGESFATYEANCDHEMNFSVDEEDDNFATLLYPTGVASFERPSVVALVDFVQMPSGKTVATLYAHDEATYLQRRTMDNLPAIIAEPLRCDWQ